MSTDKMNSKSTDKLNKGTDKMNTGTAKMGGSQKSTNKAAGDVFSAGQTIVLNGKKCIIEKRISGNPNKASIYKVNIDGKSFALKHYNIDNPLSDTAKEVLTNIKDNPKNRVIQVFDFGRYNDQDYEILEYAEGGTLDEFLKKNGGVKEINKLKTIVKQINEGLQQLHSFYKVIYQDLKPENIYFKDKAKSSLVLADFDISSVMRGRSEEAEVIASNTDLYGAPELAIKAGHIDDPKVIVTPAVDYFALGMTMYELWLGEPPFTGISAKMRERKIRNKEVDLSFNMQADYITLIQGLLEPNDKERYGNEQVQKWLKGESLEPGIKKAGEDGKGSNENRASTVYEPLEFPNNEYATNPKKLAELMEKYPPEGKTCLYSDNGDIIKDWLKKAKNLMLLNKVENILSEYNNDKDAGLYTAILTFDPDMPFKSKAGKVCESLEEIADAILNESAYYIEDLKKPNSNLYLYLTVREASDGKEVAQDFCNYFKDFKSAKRALTLVHLKLQQDGGITIGTKHYKNPDQLKKEKNSTQIDHIKRQIMENDSKLLVWLSEIYENNLKSTNKFTALDIPEQFFLMSLFPFLSFKDFYQNKNDWLNLLKNLIENYAGRSDFFETYAAQGLPLTGQNYIEQKTPIDYVVCNFRNLSIKQNANTLKYLIQLLCKLGADVNECSGDSRYPILNAFEANNNDLVNLLLELGADKGKYNELVAQRAEKERIEAEQERKRQEQLAEQKRIKDEQDRIEIENKRKAQYNQLVQIKNITSTEKAFQDLANHFRAMNGYENTAQLAKDCDAQYLVLKKRREEQAEEARQRQIKEEKARETKKKVKKIIVVIVSVSAVIIPILSFYMYNRMTVIDYGRFSRNLTTVIISNRVKNITSAAFIKNEKLTAINVSVDNKNYSSIDGVLYNKDGTTLIRWPIGKTAPVIIPNSVIKINDRAFLLCQLTSVTIPNSVTQIGWAAFMDNQLTSVTIPNNVTSIGTLVFDENPITSITIGANVKIGSSSIDYSEVKIAGSNGFEYSYARNGYRAGTYTRPNVNSDNWTWTQQ